MPPTPPTALPTTPQRRRRHHRRAISAIGLGLLVGPALVTSATTSAQTAPSETETTAAPASAPSTTFFALAVTNSAAPASAPASVGDAELALTPTSAVPTTSLLPTTSVKAVATPIKLRVEATTVTALAPGEPLPNTGAFSWRLLVQGLGLVALGTLVMTRERRRPLPRHLSGLRAHSR